MAGRLAPADADDETRRDRLPPAFLVERLPNHLTPYVNWWAQLPLSLALADGWRAHPADIPELEVPGLWSGVIERYALSEASVRVLWGLHTSGNVRSLPRAWQCSMYAVGVLSSPDVVPHRVTTELQEAFATAGYATLKGLVRPALVGALRMHYRSLLRAGALRHGDRQSDQRWIIYQEPVAVRLQRSLAGLVSAVVDHQVKPSYVYSAIYGREAMLPPHTDREQCEYTISLAFEMTPEPAGECPWPLRLTNVPGQDSASHVYQRLGDAVIFKGRLLEHGRSPLAAGHTFGTVLLHYVDADFTGELT